jgi:hypothetical protein
MAAPEQIAPQVVERCRIVAGGASGNPLERVTLGDGRHLLCKRVSPEWDWISRATGDRGRALSMWRAGLFDRLPESVEHAIVSVEPTTDSIGWDVYMHDVSEALVGDDQRLDRRQVRTVLTAITAVHATFRGEAFPELCSLEDRYRLLSPHTARRERGTPAGDLIERSWDAFMEFVPTDVSATVTALAEDPTPLANALRSREQTLIHGDLRLSNLGIRDEGIVLIDWGERSGPAPAAVELASFLVFDAQRLDVGRDVVVDDFRSISGDAFDEYALHLALIGGLVQLGCHCVLEYVLHGGDAARARAEEELAWWTARVRSALETWSPSDG